MISVTEAGWIGLPSDHAQAGYYHLAWVYSNAEGQTWTFIDTGALRFFERDGDPYVSLTGHSRDVGPDGTGWYGHYEVNLTTGDVSRFGHGLGEAIDQLACDRLAP